MRADHLDDVAGSDVFLGFEDVGQELIPGHVRLERDLRNILRHGDRDVFCGLFQKRDEPLDFVDGVFVRFGGSTEFVEESVDQDS